VEAGRSIFMMAENYCYFRENLIVSAMAERGLFGEPYYAEGQYLHEVRFLQRDAHGNPTWRMKWQVGIRGNTYITHELGPVMRWFRACDPAIRIESVACFGTGTHTDPGVNHDDSCTTIIKLSNGALINIRLDMLSNRPEKIAYALQGTRGVYEADGEKRVWIGDDQTVQTNRGHRPWQDLEDYANLLSPELARELADASNSGHGGSDYMTGRRFAQAIVGERPPEITAQESLEWTVAGLLSQRSILEGSRLVGMPL
jgi:predicted dehydrogenase